MARCDFNKVVNTFVANTVVAMKLKTHFTVELPKYFALVVFCRSSHQMCSLKNFTIFTTPALESSSIKKDFNTGAFQ